MIPINHLINTASASTSAYLTLLTKTGKGVTRHRASNVEKSSEGVTLIENQTWSIIQCELPTYQNFPADSGAIFVPASNPGTQIGAQILAYDRRSGRAKIAVEVMPFGKDGELVIDFKWLIKRCLDWLSKNGSNISNPFLLPPNSEAQVNLVSSHISLSDEQSDAVHSLLANSTGYVWGPPGTGKTRHVLAETVAHLIRQGKRVLVAAPTNLAVENALDAVLKLACVPDHQILRLGIPSIEFSSNWPVSCEERALKDRLSALNAQQSLIAKRLHAKQKLDALEQQIPAQEDSVNITSKNADKLDADCREKDLKIVEIDARIAAAINSSHRIGREIAELKSKHASLKLDALRNGITALELDQINLIGKRQLLGKELCNVSWLARMFTRRCEELSRMIQSTDGRLAVVERTLKSQRERSGDLETQGLRLDSEIAIFEGDLGALVMAKQVADLTRNQLLADHNLLLKRQNQSRIDATSAIRKLALMIQERGEVMALGELPDKSEITSLKAELIELRLKMGRITQNLSQKLVLGMTLDGFVGLSLNQALHFDHVVVDEAGYAPLAKILPLLTLGCP